MSEARARQVLGLKASVSPGELREAFRAAAKRSHPDMAGGSADRFREVVEAHHVLQRAQTPTRPPPSRAPRSQARTPQSQMQHHLVVDPAMAVSGGEADFTFPDGRKLKIVLPGGLRAGDRFRAEGAEVELPIRGVGAVVVRGDDIWITLEVEPRILAQGGRVTCDTPHGRRVVMISRKAASQALVRLQGQGLPPRGRHRQGHLFLKLEPAQAPPRSRSILDRLQGGWTV